VNRLQLQVLIVVIAVLASVVLGVESPAGWTWDS
jgi:hypothetical protein